jgi:predicted O-methyltransferase YrrM
MSNDIFKKVDLYIKDLFAAEDKPLQAIIPSLHSSKMQHGSISPNQGKFLQVLARLCNAKRILELGTLGGYSAVWLARALPAEGRLITIELDVTHANIAQSNIEKAGILERVEIRIGKAADILNQLIGEDTVPFDMIFIDADKPSYPEYLRLAIRLSRSGTLIVADNVVRKGFILDQNSNDEAVLGVQRFNNLLAADPSLSATIIPTFGIKDYDGMAIAVVNDP